MPEELWPAEVLASEGHPLDKELGEFVQRDATAAVPAGTPTGLILEPAETYPVIRIKVPGIPRPQGSKTSFAVKNKAGYTGKVASKESNPHVKAWRTQVAEAGAEYMELGPYPILDEPLEIEATFVFVRPKSHLLVGGKPRSSAPAQPTGHNLGDLSKLLRAIEDGLTGVVFRDDSLITSVIVKKRWGMISQTYITIRPDPGTG